MPRSLAAPLQGLIFNIQRFSIQDGPGIRTTVFFKGCPLKCPWCSNPESIHAYPEIMLRDVKCIRSGRCVDECPLGAMRIFNDHRVVDFTLCNQCLRCVDVCTAQAIERVGQWKSTDEIMDIVLRDAAYYRSTGGGLTLSGGEPLRQWRFARELAKAAHTQGIHVTLDTTGYASWRAFSAVTENVDLVLFDLKHIDTAIHRKFTGVPNQLIVKNLCTLLRDSVVKVWIRIPVIPAFNNSDETILAIAAFLRTLPRRVVKVSLLPFHQFGAAKYPALGRPYLWSDQCVESEERIEDIKKNLTEFNLEVEIGR